MIRSRPVQHTRPVEPCLKLAHAGTSYTSEVSTALMTLSASVLCKISCFVDSNHPCETGLQRLPPLMPLQLLWLLR